MTEAVRAGSTTFSAAEAIEWTKGWWRGAHPATLAGVSTDTRQMTPGALYVAIKGPTFDGHAFARQAIEAGAGAVMMDSGADVPEGIPALVVPGTEAALTALERPLPAERPELYGGGQAARRVCDVLSAYTGGR